MQYKCLNKFSNFCKNIDLYYKMVYIKGLFSDYFCPKECREPKTKEIVKLNLKLALFQTWKLETKLHAEYLSFLKKHFNELI